MASASANRRLRLVVNGKAAADPQLRSAVSVLRQEGVPIDIRVTWEAGDAARYAAEATIEGIEGIVAAGGDGTVNEVASGILSADQAPQNAMAVVPCGTANDFATGIGIRRGHALDALRLAATGTATAIDVGTVNDRIFVNVTSGGFGAEVTANTPHPLKRALGGAAYSLMGLVTAAKMNPYECRITLPDGQSREGWLLLLAVANGRQCGGGYQIAPEARLNDGLLDLFVIHDAEMQQLGHVLNELFHLTDESNQFATYRQLTGFQLESSRPLHLNLDGEPIRGTSFQFGIRPRLLPFILGPDAPLVTNESLNHRNL